MLKNEINIEELLKLEWTIKDCVFTDRYTKTNYFLLPLLNIEVDKNFYSKYINSFIDDEEKPCHIDKSITLIFKGNNINGDFCPIWDKLRTFMLNNKYYKYHYYVGNNGIENLIAFVFKIDDRYENDYNLILDGKYSKTSFEYKNCILKYHSKETKTYQILKGIFKKELWIKKEVEKKLNINSKEEIVIDKKSEYWDTFNQFREIFRTSK